MLLRQRGVKVKIARKVDSVRGVVAVVALERCCRTHTPTPTRFLPFYLIFAQQMRQRFTRSSVDYYRCTILQKLCSLLQMKKKKRKKKNVGTCPCVTLGVGLGQGCWYASAGTHVCVCVSVSVYAERLSVCSLLPWKLAGSCAYLQSVLTTGFVSAEIRPTHEAPRPPFFVVCKLHS